MKALRILAPLFAGALLGTSAAQAAPRYNLIAICTDDQARWAMSAYGNHEVQTPNMDRIAAEGALFMNAFCTTPVCSPSRATYLTGRYSTELDITDWINPNEATAGVGLTAPIWPQALHQAGYTTALVGKWHLGEEPQFHPTRMGFDHFMGFLNGGNQPMNPTLEVNGKVQKLTGSLPDILTDDAMQWIAGTQGKPFALCLHFRAPHARYLPVPPEDSAHYTDLDPKFIPTLKGLDMDFVRQQHRDYYSSVSSVDRNIGRLLDFLDQHGLTQNTIVTFTSDHGYNLGRHYISTKGNGVWQAAGPVPGAPNRPNLWDTSLRVPLAIRWPGVTRPGTRIGQAVTFLDVYRTMLGMLEIPVPPGADPRGEDFSPLLRGESLPDRKITFAQYDLHNSGLAYLRSARTDRYKLVLHFKSQMMDEMYDLQEDPDEQQNLLRGDRPPAKLKAAYDDLHSQIHEWMSRIHDPLLKTRE